MRETQVGDLFKNKGGRTLRVVLRDPLNDRVQVEFEDSLRTRWVKNADLYTKYEFVSGV